MSAGPRKTKDLFAQITAALLSRSNDTQNPDRSRGGHGHGAGQHTGVRAAVPLDPDERKSRQGLPGRRADPCRNDMRAIMFSMASTAERKEANEENANRDRDRRRTYRNGCVCAPAALDAARLRFGRRLLQICRRPHMDLCATLREYSKMAQTDRGEAYRADMANAVVHFCPWRRRWSHS